MGDNDERYVWKQAPYIPMSMVRKEVRAFGEAMERKLRENDEKRGCAESTLDELIFGFGGAVREFMGALQSGQSGQILSQAADVGNYLMMICDNLGGFQDKSEGEFIIFHPEGEGDET